jgi:hypothetical protein
LGARLAASRRRGDLTSFRAAFRRFRGFDRPNVLHLFATFEPNRRFGREFPDAVQAGPLGPRLSRSGRTRAAGRPGWVWYASPASAERIAPQLVAGLVASARRPRLLVRTPRPWTVRFPADRVRVVSHPLPASDWRRRFANADVRVVTGSRTLLEALTIGGPFLYFNGILGLGSGTRRHRPEKLQALLRSRAGRALPVDVRRDLADFGRGRRVAEVTRRAADRAGGWARFPRRWPVHGFAPGFADAGALLVTAARRLARGRESAPEIVAELRRRARV